jgi:hypothetical protein
VNKENGLTKLMLLASLTCIGCQEGPVRPSEIIVEPLPAGSSEVIVESLPDIGLDASWEVLALTIAWKGKRMTVLCGSCDQGAAPMLIYPENDKGLSLMLDMDLEGTGRIWFVRNNGDDVGNLGSGVALFDDGELRILEASWDHNLLEYPEDLEAYISMLLDRDSLLDNAALNSKPPSGE